MTARTETRTAPVDHFSPAFIARHWSFGEIIERIVSIPENDPRADRFISAAVKRSTSVDDAFAAIEFARVARFITRSQDERAAARESAAA
jgi:hypothetical protein